ncbi:hypothetical protein [Bradyrhizobium sp. 199]|uniref:hypothetical protein n=1 Tax=Bradyrhizobium sp. 199 TaxID=2782664 RepID=UPI001FF820C4|nr:hypothetical protein [Bradyrhizobium sp. 199]MCK1357730.1 hypothetical protein [Bradyrhizobium sp. 199]
MGGPPGEVAPPADEAPAPAKKGSKTWIVVVGFIGVAAATFALVRWAGTGEQPKLSVAKQWNEAIQKLGFEPVYPPVEDIQVGDVFAMISDDAVSDSATDEPFAGRSIKLLHLDMTSEIEDAYRAVYQFPATNARPDRDGQVWPQTVSTDSLFKPPATRTTLPLVLFPRFTITNVKRASGGASAMSQLLSGGFGADASSTETVEVRFSATETYGVPAVPAELRLLDFCEDDATKGFCSQQGLRKQLSILIGKRIDDKVKDRKTGVERPRFSVELALVSRVFLARSIQTSMGEDGGTRGNVGVNQQAVLPAAAAQAAPAAAGASGDGKPQSPAPTPQAGPNDAPGGAIAFERRAASNVLLPDTLLPRPVVVGFKSVRLRPGE